MAINPGDSRLPRYREGTAEPIFRKQSLSQAVCLYLTNRDVWSNLWEVYERKCKTGSEINIVPECGGPPLPQVSKEYTAAHHGILEGIVHVNPWLLDLGSTVFVEVIGRYHYVCSDLDDFECEVNEVFFRKMKQINPPNNYNKDIKKSMTNPPDDLESYSHGIRCLYDKLGGPVSGRANIAENLTFSGVLPGLSNKSRRQMTFVPQTEATKSSGYPDHPYVTFKFPFRFDINGTPDSVYVKFTPPTPEDGSDPPPNRTELFYQSVFGFAHHYSDSDPDSPSELEDSDTEPRQPIRQPGDPIIKRKTKPSKEKKIRQKELDLFHPDAYPWRPRPKRAPRNGVSWTVRAYASKGLNLPPRTEDIASMRIRKLSYVPRVIPIEHFKPPTSKTDYCLAVGPTCGHDGGVITLVAKLDRLVYNRGEPIQCDVKFHNTSIRLVHRLIVEVHQCLRTKALANRVWRSPICRRSITDLSVHGGMPVLPGVENSRFRVTLNPWPTVEQVNQFMADFRGPHKPSGLIGLKEAWALRLPRVPGHYFALEAPGRHEPVPPQHIQKRRLAPSTFSGMYEKLLSIGEPVTVMKPLGESICFENIWEGDPHANCRCVHRKLKPGEPQRSDHMPPDEPYRIPLDPKDVFPQDEEVSEARAKQNQLEPFCRKCAKTISLKDYPIQISYEVVVQAELLPQHRENPLGAESAIRAAGLGSGLLIDPSGEIVGPDGPRITLPCILAYKRPFPEEQVPIANYHVDQRQDCKDNLVVEPKVYEPSLGKGFFHPNIHPTAPCK